jgi:hypothetical protein
LVAARIVEAGGDEVLHPSWRMLPSVIGGPVIAWASFGLAASHNVCDEMIDSSRQFRIAVAGSF